MRKTKIKQNVSGCFRTDEGADDFAKLHSIAETAMKNENLNSMQFLLSYNSKTITHAHRDAE